MAVFFLQNEEIGGYRLQNLKTHVFWCTLTSTFSNYEV